MTVVNLLQLQLKEALVNSSFNSKKIHLNEIDLNAFKSEMIEFLGTSNQILISNKLCAKKSENGFFTLKISRKGVQLFHSSTLKKNVFEFSYEANALLLNQREVDISFLDSFTTKIDAIANRIVSHNYQVIKG